MHGDEYITEYYNDRRRNEDDDVDFMDVISEAYGDDDDHNLMPMGSEMREDDDNDDYLERLGASEPQQEMEVIEEWVVDPVTFERVRRTRPVDTFREGGFHHQRPTELRRRGGATIHNIAANHFTANDNISIQNGSGLIATISATDIDHPVIEELKMRTEALERQIARQIEINQELVNMIRSKG